MRPTPRNSDKQRTATANELARWRNSKSREEVLFLSSVLERMPLGISDQGDIVDAESGKKMHWNHIRTMLRQEYINAGRPLRGKALQFVIDGTIDGTIAVYQKLIAENKKPESMITLQVRDEYL